MVEIATRFAGRHPLGEVGVASRKLPALLGSRVVEQCVLGGSALLLAARLGPSAFAPVSALFVINSAAVTLSDYSVGLAILRCGPEERIGVSAVHRVRIVNAIVLVLAALVGIGVSGDAGILIIAGGAIWLTSGEAFVRKAAAIKLGRGQDAAWGEVWGALAFALVVFFGGNAGVALSALGIAFVFKHLLECAAVRHAVREVTQQHGIETPWGALWGNQALSYAVGNVDYVLVALVLGGDAFGIYTLGFRIAVAVPSIVAYAATRTAIPDLSAATGNARQTAYLRYVNALFAIGLAAAIAVVIVSPLLPRVLGSDWTAVAPTMVILAVAMPWRMIFGLVGAAAHSGRRDALNFHNQVAQLIIFAIAFALAAFVGYGAFVAVVTVGWISTVTFFERRVCRAIGITGWPHLVLWACAATVVAIGLTLVVTP